MSGKAENLDRSYSDRLSELGDRLHQHAGDEEMLEEILAALRAMLAEDSAGEVRIRAELQKRFNEGQLRPESFELVQKMLDRIGLEKTTRLDTPMPVDVPLQQTTKLDVSTPVDFPLQQTTKLVVSTPVDIPLLQTTKLDVSVPIDFPIEESTGAEVVGQSEVPLNQTVRIRAPFPVDSDSRDASPTDAVPLAMEELDDEEFINTAVLEDSSASKKASDDQLQVGSVLRDRFLLQEELSGGSMGVVFKALDRRMAEAGDDNPYVAIKVLSSKLSRNANALRALQQEAAKGRFLAHPNIVRFIDLDRDDDLYYIVMEWLEGRSLAQVLDNSPTEKLEIDMALNIVRQISRALDYAHERGVVHADVKPGNVVITPNGHAKLLDFGVARIRQKQLEGKSKFDPGVLGAASPAYSSMQVLTGEDPVPADDVFSLACLTYRLIAGIRVFGPRNAADAAADGMEPQRPQGLSDGQWKALKKALSYSRVTRFATPKDFMIALGPGGASAKPAAKVAAPGKVAPGVSAPSKPATPVITATRDSHPNDTYASDFGSDSRRSPLRLAVFGAILVALVGVVSQTELVQYVDEFVKGDVFRAITSTDDASQPDQFAATPEQSGIVGNAEIVDAPLIEESLLPDVAETNIGATEALQIDDGVLVADEFIVDELVESGSTPDSDSMVEPAIDPEPDIAPFDYSTFSTPTAVLLLGAAGGPVAEAELSILEDSEAATIELSRTGDMTAEYSVRVSEVGYSGASSPLEAGHYTLENDGVVNFVAGQDRAQVKITMPSDSLQESNQALTLQISATDDPGKALAVINLTLVDDDEPQYAPGALLNVFTFTTAEVVFREDDPAVQIDVSRIRPDRQFMDVEYVLIDGTATEGQDYFAPRFSFVSFGPGQETARILIPLGQDTLTESNETFTVELVANADTSSPDILAQVTVMIRDDDQALADQ
jgi:serine/threonine protein kinase